MTIRLEIAAIEEPTWTYTPQGDAVGYWSADVRITAHTDLGEIDFRVSADRQRSIYDCVRDAMNWLAEVCRSLADAAQQQAAQPGVQRLHPASCAFARDKDFTD